MLKIAQRKLFYLCFVSTMIIHSFNARHHILGNPHSSTQPLYSALSFLGGLCHVLCEKQSNQPLFNFTENEPERRKKEWHNLAQWFLLPRALLYLRLWATPMACQPREVASCLCGNCQDSSLQDGIPLLWLHSHFCRDNVLLFLSAFSLTRGIF